MASLVTVAQAGQYASMLTGSACACVCRLPSPARRRVSRLLQLRRLFTLAVT
jgi:hypothetical protein